MKTMEIDLLNPDSFYWAIRRSTNSMEVVQVSTIFGRTREFLTVAVFGSEERYMLDEFEFIVEITPPTRENI